MDQNGTHIFSETGFPANGAAMVDVRLCLLNLATGGTSFSAALQALKIGVEVSKSPRLIKKRGFFQNPTEPLQAKLREHSAFPDTEPESYLASRETPAIPNLLLE